MANDGGSQGPQERDTPDTEDGEESEGTVEDPLTNREAEAPRKAWEPGQG